MKKPLYAVLASKVAWEPPDAYKAQRAAEIKRLLDMLPSGNGWDGTALSDERSSPNRLVLFGSYHHMDEHGYDGWTEHQIIVTPHLAYGFDLRVLGHNKNDIKDYLFEIFDYALRKEVE